MTAMPPWRRLLVTVTLESPLALGEFRPGGQPSGPPEYLPGARLRGAAAEVLLAEGACPPAHRSPEGACVVADCPVGALFNGPGAARFHDGLPNGATDLLPATAMTCELAPGFATQPSLEPAHGVFDTLIDRTCWEILAPAGLLYVPRCPARGCGERVIPHRAAYSRVAVSGRLSHVAAAAPAGLRAHAAVDRQRRTQSPASLHLVPVVREAEHDGRADAPQPTAFRSEVLVPPGTDADLLASALTRITHLGAGRSRGVGAVRVTVGEAPAPEPVGARLERFGRALAVRRTQYARLAPLSAASLEGSYFSIDLRSDAYLRHYSWSPAVGLDADLLRAAAGIDDPTLTLVRAYVEPGWRGGWHAAWGLPRPPALVARRGSCFLFRTANLSAWMAALEALELTGLGDRTAEGFGEVRVCDPFHLVLREQAV